MRMFKRDTNNALSSLSAKARTVAGIILMSSLIACSSQSVREVEEANQEAAVLAERQAAAQLEREQEVARAAEDERARQEEERAVRELQERLQALQEQREQEEARLAQERQQREAAEGRERERLAAIAEVEAERQAKIDRIDELEQQIASIAEIEVSEEERTAIMAEALTVAEELLGALSDEQLKYENTDALGNTVEPLEKEMIAELEARKDDLVSRARQ